MVLLERIHGRCSSAVSCTALAVCLGWSARLETEMDIHYLYYTPNYCTANMTGLESVGLQNLVESKKKKLNKKKD